MWHCDEAPGSRTPCQRGGSLFDRANTVMVTCTRKPRIMLSTAAQAERDLRLAALEKHIQLCDDMTPCSQGCTTKAYI